MKKKMIAGAFICLIALSLFIAFEGYSQVDREIQEIGKILEEQMNEVTKWEVKANILVFLTIVVGALGVATGVFQKFEYKWCKVATMIAGAVISLIMVITNTVFDIDHRTLRSKAHEARRLAYDVRILLAQDIDEEDRQAWLDEIQQKLHKISDLGADLYSTQISFNINLTSTAYAQSQKQLAQQPEWITKTPSDKMNLYFTGFGEGTTIKQAKENSFQDAIDLAAEYLIFQFRGKQQSEPDSINIKALSEYLIKSAKTRETYLDPNRPNGLYHYYTLLALNRGIADTDMRFFAVKERVQLPRKFRESLEKAQSMVEDRFVQMRTVYKDILTSAKDSLSVQQYKKFLEGQRLRKTGDFEGAINVLKEVTREDPMFYLGWYVLAQVYDDLDNFPQANQAYKKAAELEPTQPARHASFYNTYGYFLIKHKKYEDAIVYLKKAVEIDPDHPYAARNLKAAEAALK